MIRDVGNRQKQYSYSGGIMKIWVQIAVVAILFGVAGTATLWAQKTTAFNFSRDSQTDAYSWLQQQGFVLKNGADDKSKFNLSFSANGLVVQALKPALGLLVKDGLRIKNFKKMTVQWGVNSYPAGANWDTDIHNEPLMIYVFFGNERYSSDSLFIPNSPPYIGFYLGQHDKVGGCHTGRHFTTGGRYICVANPPAGSLITSEIDLVAEFKRAFGDSIPMPSYISGISIECDTSALEDGNTSSSFVKSIDFSH